MNIAKLQIVAESAILAKVFNFNLMIEGFGYGSKDVHIGLA